MPPFLGGGNMYADVFPEHATYADAPGPKPETARNGRVGISIFTPGDLDPDNLCTILDRSGVVINAGIHNTQLLHRLLGVKSTARVSLYFYNTRSEIDVFIAVLKEALTQKR